MGKVNILVQADSRGAVRALARTRSSVEDLSASGSKAGSRLSRVLGFGVRTAAIAAGAGMIALGVGARKAIGDASDLSETLNKSRVVFGRASAAVERFGSTAAENLGLSRNEAIGAAATFGTLGKGAGLAGSDLAGFSTDLVQAASDLASFNNADPTQVLEDLRSGLTGEVEPLRKYGILLNDAALRQEALKLGLVKTTKDALSPQNKMLAAQRLILEKLGPATGDFARTSEGLANQQRILRAQLEDVSATLGAKLLPVAVAVVGQFNDLVDFIGRLARAKDIDMAINIVMTAGGRAVTSIQEALFGGGRKLIKGPGGRTLDVEIDTKGIVGRLADDLAKQDMGEVASTLAEGMITALEFTNDQGESIVSALTDAVVANSDEMADAGATIALKLVARLLDPAFWAENWDTILAIALSLFPVSSVAGLGGKIGLTLGRTLGRGLLRGAGRLMGRLFNLLPGGARTAFTAVFGAGRRAFQAIVGNARAYLGTLFGETIPGLARQAWYSLLTGAKGLWKQIRTTGREAFNGVKNKVSDILGPIGRIAAKIVGWKTAIDTAVEGVKSLIEWVNNLIDRISHIDFPSPPSFGFHPFGLGRATGGRVASGVPVVVGEHRPEVFVPDSAGRIRPRVPGGMGGGTLVISPTLIVQGRQDAHRQLDRLFDQAGFGR